MAEKKKHGAKLVTTSRHVFWISSGKVSVISQQA